MPEAAERESWDIAWGVEKLSGVPIPEYKKFLELEICAETENSEDALMPTIKYAFKGWEIDLLNNSGSKVNNLSSSRITQKKEYIKREWISYFIR